MRTLALTTALVTALTGTGCIVSSTDPVVGDADIAWRFQNSQGQLAGTWTQGNTGCGQAAIDQVRLTMWDSFNRMVVDDFFPCVDGTGFPRAYISNLAVGSYSYALEAWRVDAPVFSGDGFVDVFANQATQEDATLPVLATVPLTVYFTQNGARTCSGTPQIRFDIFFPATGSTLLEPSTTIACGTSNFGYTAQFDQPVGNSFGYDIFALDALGASVNERCLQTVLHTGFPATIDLLPAPQASCGP